MCHSRVGWAVDPSTFSSKGFFFRKKKAASSPAPKVETPILRAAGVEEGSEECREIDYSAGPGARKEQTPTTSAGERETQRIMASNAMESSRARRLLRQMLSIHSKQAPNDILFLPLLHLPPRSAKYFGSGEPVTETNLSIIGPPPNEPQLREMERVRPAYQRIIHMWAHQPPRRV